MLSSSFTATHNWCSVCTALYVPLAKAISAITTPSTNSL
ncbi:Uncharacterised protein [Vibrio cholerae]|nr:Uncharacterised protein [Vibrio cholerae]